MKFIISYLCNLIISTDYEAFIIDDGGNNCVR